MCARERWKERESKGKEGEIDRGSLHGSAVLFEVVFGAHSQRDIRMAPWQGSGFRVQGAGFRVQGS